MKLEDIDRLINERESRIKTREEKGIEFFEKEIPPEENLQISLKQIESNMMMLQERGQQVFVMYQQQPNYEFKSELDNIKRQLIQLGQKREEILEKLQQQDLDNLQNIII